MNGALRLAEADSIAEETTSAVTPEPSEREKSQFKELFSAAETLADGFELRHERYRSGEADTRQGEKQDGVLLTEPILGSHRDNVNRRQAAPLSSFLLCPRLSLFLLMDPTGKNGLRRHKLKNFIASDDCMEALSVASWQSRARTEDWTDWISGGTLGRAGDRAEGASCPFEGGWRRPTMKPQPCRSLPLSSRSLQLALIVDPPASRNFCTSCFAGFGSDVWSRACVTVCSVCCILRFAAPVTDVPSFLSARVD
ncbi:hypothetical protein L3Q82_005055 [Scortum barcoo]|uniref:Uncharacterized protein n=1 Tax=Scortum barcoo TaxID=214431 RepID=A0ACB8VDU4_9TELE|nr:hypothetical protein L3Q82_005055 [Scortum barcoo]